MSLVLWGIIEMEPEYISISTYRIASIGGSQSTFKEES